jgi:hypothetical protein
MGGDLIMEKITHFAQRNNVCPICWQKLVREHSGPDDFYICCPSHEEGHTVYLEGDRE